jgi:hypothetical protein
MSNPLDQLTAKEFTVVVHFEWGHKDAREHAYYARWDSDIVNGDVTYASAPELSAETDKQHGGVQDTPFLIVTRDDRLPVNRLIRPYAHAVVTVEIGELDPSNPAGTYRVHFKGKIVKSVRNKYGLKRLVELTVVGWKEGTGYPLGVICNNACAHIFADAGCGIHILPLAQYIVCDQIIRDTIRLPGVDWSDTRLVGDGYVFGEASCRGLSLMITAQLSSDRFTLIKPPPPEWLTDTIAIYPGCDKRYDGGCTKWQNRRRFLGLGFSMPSNNPLSEPG